MDELIREAAKKHGTSPDLLKKLLEWERPRVHLNKRRGLKKDLRRILESHCGDRRQ